jgi:hypothetical protein
MIRAKHFGEHHRIAGGSSEKIGEATQQGRQESLSSEMMQPVWQLQQQVGNQTVQQLLRSGLVQPKLAISGPDDPEGAKRIRWRTPSCERTRIFLRLTAPAPVARRCAKNASSNL